MKFLWETGLLKNGVHALTTVFFHLLIVMLFYSAIFNEKLNLFFKKGDDEC